MIKFLLQKGIFLTAFLALVSTTDAQSLNSWPFFSKNKVKQAKLVIGNAALHKRSIREDRAQRVVRSQWDRDSAAWLYFKDTTFLGYYSNGYLASEKVVYAGAFANFKTYNENEYDGAGRILRNVYFYVNENGTLDTSSITTYTYDNDILVFKRYLWREMGSTVWNDWEETRCSYVLKANTDRVQTVINEFRTKEDPFWEIQQRLNFEYNAKNEPSKIILETWNSSESKYVTAAMYDTLSWRTWVKNDHPLENSEFNMVEGTVSFLGGGRLRLRRSYDAQNNLNQEITYLLNGSDSMISDGIQNLHTYDLGSNRTQTRLESWWDADSAKFIQQSFFEYSDYFTPTALGSTHLNLNFKLYPNPAVDQLCVTFSGDAPLHLELIALSSGQNIMEKQIHSGEILDITQIPPGVYVYRVTSDQRLESGKLIKQ